MSQPLADTTRRGIRCLAPVALFALAPKCVLCVLAYAGIGTALGLGGRELCGGSGGPAPYVAVTLGAAATAAATLSAFAVHRWRRRP